MNIRESIDWYAREHPYNGPGMGEPCCNYVARVLRRAARKDTDDYYRTGGEWWTYACIWEGRRRMAPVPAYSGLVVDVTGHVPEVTVSGLLNPAMLVADIRNRGGWWVVQGWRPNGTGHQFLVRQHTSPAGSLVVDSTEARGYREQLVDLASYLDQFNYLGAVKLPTEEEALMAEEALLGVSAEVTEQVLDELKAAGREAIATAIAKLADATADGTVSPEDAGEVAGAILDEVLDGAVAVVDALLPLPEPYESLMDLGIDQLAGILKEESGPLDDIADAVVDAFDGPEVEDIERKLARHLYRFRVQGKRASARKAQKHGHRMLKHFPGRAETLGIRGELGNRSSVDLSDVAVYIPDGDDVPAVRPR